MGAVLRRGGLGGGVVVDRAPARPRPASAEVLVARALHCAGVPAPASSRSCTPTALRSRRPCSSELFGHERGAFTGAVARADRAAERAATLFLDEIGGGSTQRSRGRHLRVLGAAVRARRQLRPAPVRRARIVAATQRDIAADVRAGRFRADLFYRLDVIRIAIPPLRARREDDRTALRGAARADRRAPRRHVPAAALGCRARRGARQHAWPGNVRELENVLERLSARLAGCGDQRRRGVRERSAPPGPRRDDRLRERRRARRPRARGDARRTATSPPPRARSACRAPRCGGGSRRAEAPRSVRSARGARATGSVRGAALVRRAAVLAVLPRGGARLGGAARRRSHRLSRRAGDARPAPAHPARAVRHGRGAAARLCDRGLDDRLGERPSTRTGRLRHPRRAAWMSLAGPRPPMRRSCWWRPRDPALGSRAACSMRPSRSRSTAWRRAR